MFILAYIDPATGTIILQTLIGAIAIGLGTLTFYWRRVKQFITRRRAPKEGGNNDQS